MKEKPIIKNEELIIKKESINECAQKMMNKKQVKKKYQKHFLKKKHLPNFHNYQHKQNLEIVKANKKNGIRKILYLLYQHSKTTKKLFKQQFNQVILQMEDNELIITAEPETFHFDLPNSLGVNLKHETDIIIKYNELLPKRTIKNEVRQLRPNRSMETIFINTKNSKTNKLHEFSLNLSQRSDFKISYNILLFKNYIFITRGKIQDNSAKTINSK